MKKNELTIIGAKVHNLKNVNMKFAKNQLVVFSGVSGSGKSSMAMDTIYAEGQRRYVESLSSYARQFLGRIEKPEVESIEGLSPAIAIDQKTVSHNPRSTVGTITEIYDYMRLLFARIGHPHCPNCGREISPLSIDQIVDNLLSIAKEDRNYKNRGCRVLILSPIVRDKKGEFLALFQSLRKQGFNYARIDGHIRSILGDFILLKNNRHSIEVVVDRITVTPAFSDEDRIRIASSCELALKLSEGFLIFAVVQDNSFDFPTSPEILEDHLLSEQFACPVCNIALGELEPRYFSFNSPHGACGGCSGLGTIPKIEETLLYNDRLSVMEGGIFPWTNVGDDTSFMGALLTEVAKVHKINLHVPIAKLDSEKLKILFHGTGNEQYLVDMPQLGKSQKSSFEGLIPNLIRRYEQTDSDYMRSEIEKFMIKEVCPDCDGMRLKKETLSVTVHGKNIVDVSNMPIRDLKTWFDNFTTTTLLSQREQTICQPIVKEIIQRSSFLLAVGLDYLTLSRSANTLAGGEAQRIRLASQIGAGLSGVLYVLDEPSIGLHDRDQEKLIKTLHQLRDLGNTVIVVEHDPLTIMASDYIFDFGPGAGKNGGEIVAQGTVDEIMANKNSPTGRFLSGRDKVEVPSEMIIQHDKGELQMTGCRGHNLKDVHLTLPLGKLVCVTGVSGSGKSTLINDTLLVALRQEFGLKIQSKPQPFGNLIGIENITNVIDIDQSPIGRTPRSNPATYTKVFDSIRDLFAQTSEAKIRGYSAGRFSFNVKGGRCEVCQGDGVLKIEMQFLPDIYVECEVCKGTRYNRETLDITYKEKNIYDVLNMSVDDAYAFFAPIPKIRNKLEVLTEVGLGYLALGQSATTLSGGEAQRLKLASELSKRQSGNTLYILDEPTTGLHFADLKKLITILRMLVNKGNSVVVIEHNLDIIKNADWVIDLGEEGGDLGGKILFEGPVSELLRSDNSHTGKSLARYLKGYNK